MPKYDYNSVQDSLENYNTKSYQKKSNITITHLIINESNFLNKLKAKLDTDFYKESLVCREALCAHLTKKSKRQDREFVKDLFEELDKVNIKFNFKDISETVFKCEKDGLEYWVPAGKLSKQSYRNLYQRIPEIHINKGIFWNLGDWRTVLVIPPEILDLIRKNRGYIQKTKKNEKEKGYDIYFYIKSMIFKVKGAKKLSIQDFEIKAEELLNRWDKLNWSELKGFPGINFQQAKKVLQDASELVQFITFDTKKQKGKLPSTTPTAIKMMRKPSKEEGKKAETDTNGEVEKKEDEDDKGELINLKPDYSLFSESKINIEEIKRALLRKKQIILLGPPGTSKSFLAEQIAMDIAKKEENYDIVQFHPAYSYEDFIEAITTDNKKNLLEFVPTKKIFRLICEEAQKKPNEKYVLIIDEINRGNVEKIFGELIWALEKRNKPIRTLYFKDKLTVPTNLLIIGTMNTVDLSIANIDAALRRRFFMISVMPDAIILENWLKLKFGEKFKEFQKELTILMKNLNIKISSDKTYLGPYRQLGHTYFFVESTENLKELISNFEMEWNYSIRPLLLEYLNFNEEYLKEYDITYQEFKNKMLRVNSTVDNQ